MFQVPNLANTTNEGPITQNGFRELAGYIFGGNKKRTGISDSDKETIANDRPRNDRNNHLLKRKNRNDRPGNDRHLPSTKQTTMSFILPSKYRALSAPPVTKDPSVVLEEIEPYTITVLLLIRP
jgi:hypothetical protein